MQITRSNTILYCSRWSDTVAFYRDVIGLDSTVHNDWFVEFDLHNDTHLSVADAAHTTVDPSHGAGLTLSWNVDDLDATCARLADRGVNVPAQIRRWGALAVFVRDPEGNRIELWEAEN